MINQNPSHRLRRTSAVLVAVLAGALMLASCGSSSGSSGGSGGGSSSGAKTITLGGAAECATRPDCLKGYNGGVYDLGLKFKTVDYGPPLVEALKADQIQVAQYGSTAPEIAQGEIVELKDDKGLQSAQNVVPIYRSAIASSDLTKALDTVSAKLSTKDLAQWNQATDVEKDDPADVATKWLKDKDLTGSGSASGKIRISSQDFSEQKTLAEVYGQYLKSQGFDVDIQDPIGTRTQILAAMDQGKLDLQIDYAGSLVEELKGKAANDPEKNYSALTTALKGKDLEAAKQAQAADANALVALKSWAKDNKVTTISDLAKLTK